MTYGWIKLRELPFPGKPLPLCRTTYESQVEAKLKIQDMNQKISTGEG